MSENWPAQFEGHKKRRVNAVFGEVWVEMNSPIFAAPRKGFMGGRTQDPRREVNCSGCGQKELLTRKAPEGAGSQNYSGSFVETKALSRSAVAQLGMQRINQQCVSWCNSQDAENNINPRTCCKFWPESLTMDVSSMPVTGLITFFQAWFFFFYWDRSGRWAWYFQTFVVARLFFWFWINSNLWICAQLTTDHTKHPTSDHFLRPEIKFTPLIFLSTGTFHDPPGPDLSFRVAPFDLPSIYDSGSAVTALQQQQSSQSMDQQAVLTAAHCSWIIPKKRQSSWIYYWHGRTALLILCVSPHHTIQILMWSVVCVAKNYSQVGK